jgi:hypothetical protein
MKYIGEPLTCAECKNTAQICVAERNLKFLQYHKIYLSVSIYSDTPPPWGVLEIHGTVSRQELH